MRIHTTNLLFRAAAGAAVFTVLLERFTLWGTLLGAAAAVCAAITGYAADKAKAGVLSDKRRSLKTSHGFLLVRYGILLIFDMAASTVRQIKTVLGKKTPVPAIVHIRPKADSRGRVLVSNSITLTPGTVTLEETEEDYAVLCAAPPESSEQRCAIASDFEGRLPGKEEES